MGEMDELVPERGSVFAVVAEGQRDGFALLRRWPGEWRVRPGWSVLSALEEAAVLALHFFKAVAGHDFKRGIDVEKREVGQLSVGNADTAGDGLEDVAIEAELFKGRLVADGKGAMRVEGDAELGGDDVGSLRENEDRVKCAIGVAG